MNIASFKRIFLFSLIGSLIVSAAVAIFTVLLGEFNDTAGKVLLTLLMVVVHSLISLGLIWDDERQHTFERLALFSNTIFLLIVVSFITSLFAVWDIMSSDLASNLYQMYAVVALSALHADVLIKFLGRKKYLDGIVITNVVFIIAVAFMLQPIIYIEGAFDLLDEVYFRILGAAGIVDATLTILAVIFYKLYLRQNPQEEDATRDIIGRARSDRPRLSPWIRIFIAYLVLQLIFLMLPLLSAI